MYAVTALVVLVGKTRGATLGLHPVCPYAWIAKGPEAQTTVGAMHANSDRDRILAATDLVALVGEQVKLDPKGSEFIGLCPFHDDARPSMYVVPAKSFYHCFACGAHGNAIDFLMNLHNMEFREALEALGNRAGIELTRQTETGRQSSDRRRQLFRANQLATRFFTRTLTESTGEPALSILQDRGIDAELIERFAIGAAPDSWDGLKKRIEEVHRELPANERDSVPSPDVFEAAGLLRTGRTGDLRDYFHNRIIFPIRDELGRSIAFGARRINPDDEPKYLNSPETDIFQKSSTLYGLDLAAKAIGRTRTAIVTEGYTDVIALHAAGFQNAVATLGTALTREHAQRLGRFCDCVILLFDGDEAGRRATDRAVEVFFSAPVDVRLCALPDGCDPDDLLRQEDGPAKFQAALDNASDAFMSMLKRFREQLDTADGITARARVVEGTLAKLASLGVDSLSGIRRRFVLDEIAKTLGFTAQELQRLTTQRGAKKRSEDDAVLVNDPEPIVRAPRARRLAEERLISFLLADPALMGEAVSLQEEASPATALEHFSLQHFQDPLCRMIWTVIEASSQEETQLQGPDLVAELTDQEAGRLAASIFVEGIRILSKDEAVPLELLTISCVELVSVIERQDRAEVRDEATGRSIEGADDAARAIEDIRKAGSDPASIPRTPRGGPRSDSA